MNWYYLNTEQKAGPFSEETMLELKSCGMLTAETQVAMEGTEDWGSFGNLIKATTDIPQGNIFKFDCPHCQQSFSAEPGQSGATCQCPACSTDFVIPSPEEEAVIEVPSLAESAEATSSGEIPPDESNQLSHSPKTDLKHSFADRIKEGSKVAQESAMVGWSGIKRHSKQAALKVQIEKLRNIDLRKAHHALGKIAFEQGVLSNELTEHFKTIQDLDARITGNREKTVTDTAETKMAALKRIGKDTAKSGQAQALTVKREHLITELGREIHSRKVQISPQDLVEERNVISDIEQQIQGKEEEMRRRGEEGRSLSASTTESQGETLVAVPFSYRSAVPLFVCCLGFGWIATWFLPMRIFAPEFALSSLAGTTLLALPAVCIAYLGIGQFLGFPKTNWRHLLGALVFTMFAGIFILLTFHKAAEASQTMRSGFYGKATPFVLAVKLIGWAADFRFEGNVFQRLFGSIIHTGFCEEVTKLLPLFIIVILNRKKETVPNLSNFLMIAFFSGLGFGIAEAIRGYSPWTGNPVLESNVVRWYACVPLHAIYTVIDASILWLLIPEFKKAKSLGVASAILLMAATLVAVIHGLYNTISGLHSLLGLALDGGAIALMVFLVHFCMKREQSGENNNIDYRFPVGFLPTWLRSKNSAQPSFIRLFSAAGILMLVSTLFAFSPPPLSTPTAQSFAAEIESRLGIEFNEEAALMYAGGYVIGSNSNRPAPPGSFEYIVRQTMAENPHLPAAFGELLYLGMQDGYDHLPNRLESGGSSLGEASSLAEQGESGYRSNQADQSAIKRLNSTYSVTQTIGKRNGLSDFEILFAAVEATDWSGASASLRAAVRDFQSIKSGEPPASRNKKLEPLLKMIEIYE